MGQILIVEDDWLIASGYARPLAKAGYGVVGPFAHVEPALQAVEEQPVTAGLLDLNLGSRNSLPVANLLQERDIPFAFLTAYHRSDLPQHLLGRPLIAKPVTSAMLLDIVRKMLTA